MRTKKSFGQHFLVNKGIVQKIIDAAAIQSGESVLEVGPGEGVLTEALIEAGANVIAVEADRDLIPVLEGRFGDSIKLIHRDILEVPNTKFAQGGSYKVVANLPYNIASAIIKKFLTESPKPSELIVMIQKEVADRIVEKPGNMSLLSIACQLYADCERLFIVKPGSFNPPPKVDSAVIRIVPKDANQLPENPEEIISLARIGFSARRKTLVGNLVKRGGYEKEEVLDAFQKVQLDPRIRAEALSIDQWITLAEDLH